MAKNKNDEKTHGGPRPGSGRPVSEATIRAQLAREYISKQMQLSLAPIVAKAITQAIEGDDRARDWLSSYAWGKPKQDIAIGAPEGIPDEETLAKARQAIGAVLDTGNVGEGEQ